MCDPFGQAIHDYYTDNSAEDIIVSSNYTEDESIPISYLFRGVEEMPLIEKKAIELCRSNVLDVGAGAGCHSIILQEKGFNITSIDTSSLACQILHKMGIKNVLNQDIFKLKGIKFNTILLLMNGTGIAGDIKGLRKLLNHLKKLLKTDGQILIDSSDIKYLFQEDDGSFWIDLNRNNYYGEMEYEMKYKNCSGQPFKWLFIDFENLKTVANLCQLNCEKIMDGEHYDYLARITF